MNKIKRIVGSVGPGLIIAAVVLGPGSITVASRIGAEYGYAFLWVIILATIFMITYTSMGARFGAVNNISILSAIADRYGRVFAVIIGISAFLSTSSFQFGNNLGIGIGMEGITGIQERVWPIVFTCFGILLIFWAKNLYKVLERLMISMVMIMIFAFVLNLVLTKPNMGSVARGFIPSSLTSDNLQVVAALMATSFALAAALYQSYLAQDKGWTRENLRKGLSDTYIGILLLALITSIILITAASALHPRGIVVNSAADMALQMEALFGSSAKIIFSLGLCAAAFSSMMVNAVIGGGLLSDGLGLGRSMNDPVTKIFTMAVLLIGMIVAVFFSGNAVYALILAQASSMLAVPLIALGLFLILNNKRLMGKHRNNTIQNIIAITAFIVITLMVFYMYQNLSIYLRSI